jgi:hypothetical protein
MKQLSIAQCSGYPTYLNTSYGGEENLAYHKSFISSLNILFNKGHDDFLVYIEYQYTIILEQSLFT